MDFTEEQKQAINEEGTNIIVSAGAGSGKTAVLSERVLRKIKDGIHIDELLILTFTNAAAKEMKSRIRKKLIQQNLKEEQKRLEKSYITTFDSFALAMVKKYHETLGISRDIEICDQVFIDLKMEEILEDIFQKLYREKDENFLDFISDFCSKDDKTLKKNILKIYSQITMRYDEKDYLKNYMNTYFNPSYIEEKKQEFLSLLQKRLHQIASTLYDLSKALDKEEYIKYQEVEKLVKSTTYQQMQEHLACSIPRLNKNYDEEAKKLKTQLASMLKEFGQYFIYQQESDITNEIISTKKNSEVLVKILQQLQSKLEQVKKEEGLYTFTDIFKLAISLVENYPDVRQDISDKFQEIMIDEYQDNNDLQEQFIKAISHHNVYMVGDIKQSIYRFRNANPNIFKEKYEQYQTGSDGIKIDLNKNFRSRSEVLDDINRIFNRLMDLSIGGADYEKSHQMIFGNEAYNQEAKTNQDYQLELLTYKESEDKNISKEEQEIFLIAEDIQNKVKNHYQIYDKEERKLREIKYSDIVILLDKSKYFDLYKKIFEYFKIPLSVYQDADLKEDTDIFVLNHLLKFIRHIKEKNFDTSCYYSFVSIARSYLFQLPDDEIFTVVNNKNLKETEIYQKAQTLSESIDNENPLSFYQQLLDTFAVEEKLVTATNIKSSRIRLEYFYRMLSSLVQKGYTIDDFSQYLDTLYEGDYHLSFALNKEEENACKIMTIHKSKGLEYPLCYFASFTGEFNLQDLNSRILYDKNYQIVLPSIQEEGIKPTIYKQLLKENAIKEEIGEKIRLLYVALTRCREKMVIVLPNKEETTKEKEKYRTFLDMLECVHEELSSYIKLVPSNVTKDYLKKEPLQKKITQGEKIEVKELHQIKKVIEEKRYSKKNIVLRKKEEEQILNLGTKIHEILEFIDIKNPNFEGIDKKYINKIKAFLQLDIIKDNLDQKFYHEYEFIREEEQSISHGIIDLLIEKEEELIIIDYKLKNIDDKKYIDQLSNYKKTLQKQSKKKISCYLYSIIEEKLVNIDSLITTIT